MDNAQKGIYGGLAAIALGTTSALYCAQESIVNYTASNPNAHAWTVYSAAGVLTALVGCGIVYIANGARKDHENNKRVLVGDTK